jgi:glycosyltransferase involved in cell wall biosynthesis
VLRASVIIPTYNRQEELKACVESLLEQTVLPYEVIIVDDGNLTEVPYKEECKRKGIHCVYLKKDQPDANRSRNEGVRLAGGDILFFLDDDVVLYPDYIAEILSVYNDAATNAIGGVGGVLSNRPFRMKHRVKRILEVMFLISGFREGKVLPSGFCTEYGNTGLPIEVATEVDFLSGGAMSFRKEVFKEFSFTEGMRVYGLGEDKDFSYPVSRKYKLILSPRARLVHMESPKMRPDEKIKIRKTLIGRYYFFKKHVKKFWWSWILFYYALAGFILTRMIIFAFSPGRRNYKRLQGTMSALKSIIKGDIIVH